MNQRICRCDRSRISVFDQNETSQSHVDAQSFLRTTRSLVQLDAAPVLDQFNQFQRQSIARLRTETTRNRFDQRTTFVFSSHLREFPFRSSGEETSIFPQTTNEIASTSLRRNVAESTEKVLVVSFRSDARRTSSATRRTTSTCDYGETKKTHSPFFLSSSPFFFAFSNC